MQLHTRVQNRRRRCLERLARRHVVQVLLAATATLGCAQPARSRLLVRIADRIVAQDQGAGPEHPTSAERWNRQTALKLEGVSAAWYSTADGEYYRYLQKAVDDDLKAGSAAGAAGDSDRIAMGGPVLLLYRVTLHKQYYEAAAKLHMAAAAECGLNRSPSQSADGDSERIAGVCTAAPFLAEYASVFQDPKAFVPIAHELERWDVESASARGSWIEWSMAQRDSFAWEAKSIVDALPYFPEKGAERPQLAAALRRIASELVRWPKPSTAMKVRPRRDGSVDDADSASKCLLVYAVFKGVRLGYLPESDAAWAEHAWSAIERAEDQSGGGKIDGPSGAMLLAASEAELAHTAMIARGKTVMLDAWFNSQTQKNAAGQIEYFHYKWFDMSNSGYSLLGHMFRGFGMKTATLYTAPTLENLSGASYYIIVSPDIPVKNPDPHYMREKDAAEVAKWVKSGGILILMENDPPNADIKHLNILADKFGIHFDDVLRHHILGEKVEDGTIPVKAGGRVFRHAHTLYMKDTCAISLSDPATAVLRDRGDVVMATARYGRGRVFAVVDPWLYNEYTDGRKNPKIYGGFDNFGGGMELVSWLAEQRPETSHGAGTGQKVKP